MSAKHSQGLHVGLDDGTDADIDTDGAGTDGGAETGGEGTGGEDTGREGIGTDAATEKKKQRIRKPNKLGIGLSCPICDPILKELEGPTKDRRDAFARWISLHHSIT